MSLLTLLTRGGGQVSGGGTPPATVKNPQLVRDSTMYEGFGHCIVTPGGKEQIWTRIGTGHLEEGALFKYEKNAEDASWGSPIQMEPYVTGKDYRDVNGTMMDDGRHVYGSSISSNGLGGGSFDTDEYFIRIGNPDTGVYGSKIKIFGVGGLIEGQVTQLERGTLFASPKNSGTPGEYGWILNQFDIVGNRKSITFIHTTNYFTTATAETVVSGTGTFWSESSFEWLPGGDVGVWSRIDQGSYVIYLERISGTWHERGQTNIGYSYLDDKVIWTDKNLDGTVNIIIQDRTSGFISISPDNDPAVFVGFGTPPINFNPLRVYFFNYFGSGGNPFLGYFSRFRRPDGVYLCTWAAEYQAAFNPSATVAPVNPGEAKLWWTYDNFILPVAASLPAAPKTFTFHGMRGTDVPTYIGSNYFRVDLIDYTADELNNIDYWLWDVSTDPTFAGSFITTDNVMPSTLGGHPVPVFHDFHCPALFIQPRNLSASTTYYFRVKAVNAFGESAYKSSSVTTTA